MATAFKDPLNSSHDNSMQDYVLQRVYSCKCLHIDINMFSLYDVKNAIKALKAGKSAGMDGLGSEHYKCVDERLYVLFSLLFISIKIIDMWSYNLFFMEFRL